MLEQLLLFIIAIIANGLSALAGGGAGLLQLPALLFLGAEFPIALATHKIATVALGVGATTRYIKARILNPRLSIIILLFGIPGVICGANFILTISSVWAEKSLGVLTIALGLYSIVKKELGQTSHEKNRDFTGLLLGSSIIFIIGFLNGSLTSGTGLFLTLWLVRWFGLDYKTAVAHTLILVGLFWNSTGAVTLGLQAPILWQWLPALIFGSLVGGFLGVHLSIIKGNKLVKRTFEMITIIVGLKLIFSQLSLS